ncbi:MAG: hypothetical protein HC781_16380 [Leptolyngbyaceae cyanobacterium CSU_1_4]|nr:hypothetical protein [Leptolyngbyaceae cyanobacterium CSU_1_4]
MPTNLGKVAVKSAKQRDPSSLTALLKESSLQLSDRSGSIVCLSLTRGIKKRHQI